MTLPPFKDFVRDQLIPALESGKFTHGTGALERYGKNCCLGVACRIIGLTSTPSGPDAAREFTYRNDDYTSGSYLPDDLAQAWNITKDASYHYSINDPTVTESYTLANVNDDNTSYEPVLTVLRDYLDGKVRFNTFQ